MPDDAEDMRVFEEWMTYRDISYETQALKLKRFESFKASLREAEEAFPLTKEPMWVHLTKFADLTSEGFCADYLSWRPESEDDEDEKNGVHAYWGVEEEGSTVGTLKRKCGLCSCDEKDTKDQMDATVKRQRPCSCFTAPAAADEQRDVAGPV